MKFPTPVSTRGGSTFRVSYAFAVCAHLPEGENVVPIEFTPSRPGEYEFARQMGMHRGKVVVS